MVKIDALKPSESVSTVRGFHPVVALKRLGLGMSAVSPITGVLSALTKSDFPTVAMLRDGTAVILLGRQEDGRYAAETVAGLVAIPSMVMDRLYSGRRFHVVGALDHELKQEAQGVADVQRELAPGLRVRRTALRLAFACKHLVPFMVARAFSQIMRLAVPLAVMVLVDHVRLGLSSWEIAAAAALALLALGFDVWIERIARLLHDAVAARISLDMAGWFFRHVTRLELSHAPLPPGAWASTMMAVEVTSTVMPALIAGLSVEVPLAMALLVYIYLSAGVVVLAALSCLVLSIAVAMVAGWRSVRATALAASLSLKRSTMVEETLAQSEAVRALGAARPLAKVWETVSDDASFAQFAQQRGSHSGQQLLSRLGQAALVLALALGFALVPDMDIGGLIAAALLCQRVVQILSDVLTSGLTLMASHEAVAAADRLAALPEEGQSAEASPEQKPLVGAIEFRRVKFSHPGEKSAVLDGVSFSIRPGEKIGIIGAMGAGKTTLVRMIPRLLTPESGSVALDGLDSAQLDPTLLRQDIAYMPQDCDLFDLTIRNNISLGAQAVDQMMLDDALALAGVRDFAVRRTAGYGFKVGSHGRKLSTGERQAVALARTLARKAAIYVFDEPTAAMDGPFERKLVERLRPKLAGKTVVIATHRAPLLALVDRIIWLDQGRIVADGARDDVLRQLGHRAASGA